MKRFVALLLLLVIGGCRFIPGERVRPGFRAEFIVPPIVRQECDYIVDETSGTRRALPLTQTLPPWNNAVNFDSRFAPADQARELYRPPAAFLAPPTVPPPCPPPLQQLTNEQVTGVVIELLKKAAPPTMPPATRENRCP